MTGINYMAYDVSDFVVLDASYKTSLILPIFLYDLYNLPDVAYSDTSDILMPILII